MPLVARACLAWAIGLLLAHVAGPPLALATLGAALGIGALGLAIPALGIRRDHATCLLLGAAAAMLAMAELRRARVCHSAIARAAVVRATLEGDARPGTVVRARLRRGACRVSGALVVRSGIARGGDDVAVAGDIGAGARGVVVRDARLVVTARRASAVALRAAVGRRIDRVFGRDAPLVRALVIADMSAIPAEQRDRFARAGLVHMLSVSGLHVAIVALALELLASAARLPRAPAQAGTLLLLGAYVITIGAPPPAVRAAIMLGLVIASRAMQRPTSRWAIVALGAVVPLVDPATVVDLGWQLSVAGTIALAAGGALARRIVPRRWKGARRKLATAAIISVVATLVTAPLVAWTFGRLAILGPVTSLIADPIMGALQPLLFLALCLPFAPVERLLADAAHALIVAFDATASTAAALPFAAPVVLPSALAACVGAAAAVALVIACLARHPVRPALVAAACLAIMTVEPLVRLPRSVTELHMIDVGQGDALALRTRAGRWVVIDAGRAWPGGDAGRSTVVPYIAHRGGEVALFVLSHPHADHVGGAASLFDALHPGRFLDPGYVGTSAPYLAALAAARRDGVPWRRVHPGDSLIVDEVVVTLLAPDSAWAAGLDDANLSSTVALVRVGAVRLLFTGDAERPEEEWLVAHAREALAADVLKVAHHGSATSTTPDFLAAVHPRVALVSVGADNSYGHPSSEVMTALRAAGAQVLRTDQLGTVVLRTDGRTIDIEARGARWRVR